MWAALLSYSVLLLKQEFSIQPHSSLPGTGDNFQGVVGGNFNDQSPGNHNSGSIEGAANVGPSNQPGIAVPDFLPPAQRVLFMRLQHKQQEDEERARRLAEGGGTERENEGTNEKHCLCLQHLIHYHMKYILAESIPIAFIQNCSLFTKVFYKEAGFF